MTIKDLISQLESFPIIEMIAALFSLISVAMAMYKNYLTFAIGMIGTILYTWIFFDYQLYADAGLQIIYIIQGIWGIIFWRNEISEGKKEIVYEYGLKKSAILFLITLLLSLILGFILEKYTNASLPYSDAALTAVSISATWLLTKKYRENWLYWIIADAAYIGLYYYKALYITALLYLIFGLMAINGWIKWKTISQK